MNQIEDAMLSGMRFLFSGISGMAAMSLTSCAYDRPFNPAVSATPSGSEVVAFTVKPGDTDGVISAYNDPHYVFRNSGSSKNTLVVHLPGTGSSPVAHQWFGKTCAELGFHAIGLMYPNGTTVGQLAANNSDLNAFESIRMEIIEGRDLGPLVEVNAANSITNRLVKLLVHLAAREPGKGWDQYLDASKNPVWSNIIFSGHSQGGGHAAMIAKIHTVKRALLFAAPKDYAMTISAPAIWYTNGSFQTPRSELYGFNHTADDLGRQKQIWTNLGMSGTEVDVFASAPPYGGSRRLLTSYAIAANLAHASVVQDMETPVLSGVPVFQPVWSYMLTNP
ncbi:MAG: hypothetical protein JNM63_11775 [Spirochaetia bacterium]|nr:hypothetical protein [Spirochaetia bacterium]